MSRFYRRPGPFSAAIRRGLIEASKSTVKSMTSLEFSAAIRRGLIEAQE